jgi:hypothetical protein
MNFSCSQFFHFFRAMTEFRGGGGGWSGFGAYMRDKTIKLAGQFDERYEQESSLLRGKTFWSTGRMAGIDCDIKELITKHGGEYLQYGFRNVTHILASNLAMSNQNWKKLIGGKFASKSYAIVTPQWLIDSVKAGQCQPESEYLPDCLKSTNDIRDIFVDNVTKKFDIESVNYDEYINYSKPKTLLQKRLVRFDISNPSTTPEVVERFCCDLLEEGGLFARDSVAITIVRNNTVTVEGLVLQATISLSEALLSALSAETWSDVKRVSLSLRECTPDSNEPHIDIFPSITGVPPTRLNNQLTSLKSLLLESDEETMPQNVTETLRNAGPAIVSILLDTFQTLLESRRLDVARDMILALRSRVPGYSDDQMIAWLQQTEAKLQQLFQLQNHGAKLAL